MAVIGAAVAILPEGASKLGDHDDNRISPSRRSNLFGLQALGQVHRAGRRVMGGGINGGRILGEQVKVDQASLFQNRDYPVLTDYRAMFAGLFQRMFGLEAASVQRIFAGVHPAELGLV